MATSRARKPDNNAAGTLRVDSRGRMRLSVDLPVTLFTQLKVHAATQHRKTRDVAEEAITQYLNALN